MSVSVSPWLGVLALLVFLAMALMVGFYADHERKPDPRWFGLAFLVLLIIIAIGYRWGRRN
jgi:hypothetical protein